MNDREREARWADGTGYDRYIQDELHTFRKGAWKRQLTQHFAPGKALDILDVGTGPGFFACILSEEGHRVTGIDASDGMLERARANAAALGVQPVFLKMDVNELDFPDEAFDAIVLRNVSWTLQYPERVYTEFKRLLRPCGVLLVYDANWQMQWFDPAILERVRARERRFLEKYGRAEIVSNGDMEYYKTASLTRTRRPTWDEKTLTDLGFAVTVTEDVGQFVYGDWEKELYGESPLFEVCAVKQAEGEALKNMHEYWQYRAETFGVGGMEELRALGREAVPCLPEGKMRVLDVGTGPGTVAMAMALLGHDVTGIDLSSNMIRRARENAAALGLDIQFLNTAAGELPFPDESFDAVVSRNLTWALPEPEATFRQWRRVLKPGGRLLYWDANHYYFYFNETDAKNREALEKLAGTVHILHRDENGNPQQLDYSLCERTAPNLPLSRFDRPSGWDETALPSLGFTILAERIYRPQHLLKYGVAKGYYTEFFIAAIRD